MQVDDIRVDAADRPKLDRAEAAWECQEARGRLLTMAEHKKLFPDVSTAPHVSQAVPLRSAGANVSYTMNPTSSEHFRCAYSTILR